MPLTNRIFSEILYLNTQGSGGWSWDVMGVSLSTPRSHHVVFPLETIPEAICNPDLPTVPPAEIPEGIVFLKQCV